MGAMAGKVIAKSMGLRRCETVEPLTHNMIVEDDTPPFDNPAAESNTIMLIHESPLTDALFLLVSKSDEVTTT